MTIAAEKLLPHNACDEAREWVRSSRREPKAMWETCERADWMLWLAGRLDIDRKLLVAAAADCAETAPNHKNVPAAVECIRILRLWCAGKATIEEVVTARRAAYAAAADAAAADAADAAAYAAYAGAARKSSLKAMAALVRHRIPWSVIAKKLPKSVVTR